MDNPPAAVFRDRAAAEPGTGKPQLSRRDGADPENSTDFNRTGTSAGDMKSTSVTRASVASKDVTRASDTDASRHSETAADSLAAWNGQHAEPEASLPREHPKGTEQAADVGKTGHDWAGTPARQSVTASDNNADSRIEIDDESRSHVADNASRDISPDTTPPKTVPKDSETSAQIIRPESLESDSGGL